MKRIQTKLIKSILKTDFLLLKNFNNNIINLDILNIKSCIISIKQLIKILNINKNLVLFIVCQNKQYNVLIKKYLINFYSNKNKIFLISYKVAVTLKMPAIYFLLDCENIGLLSKKIQEQSNSIIYIVSFEFKKNFGEYYFNTSVLYIKQILFFLCLIKKIKN